ncbi:MAG: FAD-dependent oxidoreductase [Gammaproteobacteria bacterium]|nr:MAG: FAD-dependent oxidoreductase [Gammaproteobacteria bacterium]
MSRFGETRQVVVLGAGIVGVSAATWLRRSGHEVTLIDRLPPGEATSHGNAGILAASANVPVTTPGLVRKAPFYLLDRHFPLFLEWARLPSLAGFLREYLGYANDADTRRIARDLAFIVGDSVEQHTELAGNTAADRYLRSDDYLMAYPDRQALEADGYTWSLQAEAGFTPDILEGDAVHEREPILGPGIRCLAVMKNHGFVTSPGNYVKALAEEFQRLGGTLLQGDVGAAELVDGRVRAVPTSVGRLDCDTLVVAAGVWSARYLDFLDLRVPMQTERGYHIVFRSPNMRPVSPIMLTPAKFVVSPMDDGVRCAGTVEFGGLESGPSKAPLAFIRRKVAEWLPDFRWQAEEEWLGHRPAPVDSLPFIGEIRGSGVYTAFGHQHVGLTGGPKTGRLVAELVDGRMDPAELAAYDPMRFS